MGDEINCRHVCRNSHSMAIEPAAVDLCVLDPGRFAGRSAGRLVASASRGGGVHILIYFGDIYEYTSTQAQTHEITSRSKWLSEGRRPGQVTNRVKGPVSSIDLTASMLNMLYIYEIGHFWACQDPFSHYYTGFSVRAGVSGAGSHVVKPTFSS